MMLSTVVKAVLAVPSKMQATARTRATVLAQGHAHSIAPATDSAATAKSHS